MSVARRPDLLHLDIEWYQEGERDVDFVNDLAQNLIRALAVADAENKRLQVAYDALTGERFSDRVHAALRQRAEQAEAREESEHMLAQNLIWERDKAVQRAEQAEADLAEMREAQDTFGHLGLQEQMRLKAALEQAEAEVERLSTAHKALVNDLQAASVWSNQWVDYCVLVPKIDEALARYDDAI